MQRNEGNMHILLIEMEDSPSYGEYIIAIPKIFHSVEKAIEEALKIEENKLVRVKCEIKETKNRFYSFEPGNLPLRFEECGKVIDKKNLESELQNGNDLLIEFSFIKPSGSEYLGSFLNCLIVLNDHKI